MKKRLCSLLAIATLTTTAWADISEEQLANYMKVSGADAVLNNAQEQIVHSIKIKSKVKGKVLPKKELNELLSVIKKQENLEKWTNKIKSLDEKEYAQIIKFYNTKLGQKQANLGRNLNVEKMQKEMKTFSKKASSKERKLLISELIKLSQSNELIEKKMKIIMELNLNEIPKNMQEKAKEKMNAQLAQLNPIIKKQVKMMNTYIYKDFSDEELKRLVNYYKTSPAQAETKAMNSGSIEYAKAVVSEVIQLSKKAKEKVKSIQKELVCNQLKSLSTSLMLFKLDNTMYPSTQEGLEALLKNPDSKKYPHYAKKAYIGGMPLVDTWGSKLIYRNNNGKIELISYGADKKEGGEKENRDILLSECKK